jgi:hypothetical protein
MTAVLLEIRAVARCDKGTARLRQPLFWGRNLRMISD